MVGDVRANKVCEQLLNSVKASNLNYLVNETPYLAFITIRKRFAKGYEDILNVTVAQDDSENIEDLKRKNNLLTLKCIQYESNFETLSKENCDVKTKLENFIEDNVRVTQKLFILKGEIANKEHAFKKVQDEFMNLIKAFKIRLMRHRKILTLIAK